MADMDFVAPEEARAYFNMVVSNKPKVTMVKNEFGSYDIILRLDGGYVEPRPEMLNFWKRVLNKMWEK